MKKSKNIEDNIGCNDDLDGLLLSVYYLFREVIL